MKKIFFVGLLLIFSKLSDAQVLFGLRGGLNFANTKGSFQGMSESDSRGMRFHIGGLAEIPVSETFFVQPELLINQVGGKGDGDNDRITMLSLPILAKVKASSFSFYAGPQIDYVMTGKYTDAGVTFDVSSLFRKNLLSGTIGAEYNFESGLSLGLRYQTSFSNMLKDISLLPGYKATYSSITISAAFMFGSRD